VAWAALAASLVAEMTGFGEADARVGQVAIHERRQPRFKGVGVGSSGNQAGPRYRELTMLVLKPYLGGGRYPMSSHDLNAFPFFLQEDHLILSYSLSNFMHDMTCKTLEIAIDERGAATVCLARVETLNAFDEGMIEEIPLAFQRLGQDSGVRAVILGAEGRAFSAGADLRWMQRASKNSQHENLADARRFAAMMQSIYECPKPVVARIHGPAYGGGVGLCCACDIVIASPQAWFAVSEAKFGILPAVIGAYLNNAVGKRHALRLALTGEVIYAERAQAIGLIHGVVPVEQLDEAMEDIVNLLVKNGPIALTEIKKLFAGLNVDEISETTRELTANTIARVGSTAEAREGFAAFFEKRPAKWTEEP
jgi:methylglutaconyl-CoA hydratase